MRVVALIRCQGRPSSVIGLAHHVTNTEFNDLLGFELVPHGSESLVFSLHSLLPKIRREWS